jgi:hypothetical protein
MGGRKQKALVLPPRLVVDRESPVLVNIMVLYAPNFNRKAFFLSENELKLKYMNIINELLN